MWPVCMELISKLFTGVKHLVIIIKKKERERETTTNSLLLLFSCLVVCFHVRMDGEKRNEPPE